MPILWYNQITMVYDLGSIDKKNTEVKNWLLGEYVGIRTGRATPILLDSVTVESYGSKVPLKHVATIMVEDSRTLRLSPWDKSNIGPIEQAISQANLGVSTTPDDSSIRIIFPDLTAERRKALIKIAAEKLEEAKVSLKKERERLWSDIQNKERAGEISEDEKFQLKDDLQKNIMKTTEELEQMMANKEKEINS